MEDSQLNARLDALEKKLDATYKAAETTRKLILAGAVVTVIAFVMPLIGLVFVVPSFLSTYQQIGNIQ